MRWLVILVGLCIALTVLRAALAVLLIVLVVSILWGAFFRPAETFGSILLVLFSAVLQTHTLAVLILIGVLGFVVVVRRPVAPANAPAERAELCLPDHSRTKAD